MREEKTVENLGENQQHKLAQFNIETPQWARGKVRRILGWIRYASSFLVGS
jgi:hypothetical protein